MIQTSIDDLLNLNMNEQHNPSLKRSMHLLLLNFLLLSALIPPSNAGEWDGVTITQTNYEGLLAFKRALLDPSGYLSGWNDTGLEACSGSWVGIKCAKGQVIAIQLPWRGLGGTISDKVGQLTALRKLNLHDNALQGNLPSTIGLLPNLRGLYLFNNRLSGSIPPSFGNCLLLQTLDLSNNLLTGTIPDSISNSTNLFRLNIGHNKLVGSIPTSLTKVPSLSILSLNSNNLSGPIPDTWASTHKLKVLNLDHNSFTGTIPTSLTNLTLLQQLTLSFNQITGTIPPEVSNLPVLQRLDLSHNSITGSIPSSFGAVVNMSELDLSDNSLTGEIPESLTQLIHLTTFNVSENDLSGPVPAALVEKFDPTAFVGNVELCGYTASVPCPSPPPPPRPPAQSRPTNTANSSARTRRPSVGNVILLVIVGLVALVVVLCCVLLVFCLMRKRGVIGKKKVIEKAGTETEAGGGEGGGKLVQFDGPVEFTADDLLCATAEIMGKTGYGTVYKATLEDGNQVAVKRLREKISKNQKEFESEVCIIGKIRHTNLLPLRAYYLGPKGEKLLVFDYMPKGSLAAYLHARGPDTPIDWSNRMKIATGVARGLHHLHTHENTVHGNMSSSNILLDDDANPKISDYALSRLVTTAASNVANATAGSIGYCAPELSKQKKATAKSDVYSLGIVLLELLTGKSPGEAVNGLDLPQWVASIVEEDWASEVFDLELTREGGAGRDELLNALKLALHCVDPQPAARPEAEHVVKQLEEMVVMADTRSG